MTRSTNRPGGTGGKAGKGASAGARPPHDPLADKHRSAHFDQNWRTVNYARLNDGEAVPERAAAPERGSNLMRPDWNPTVCAPADEGKPYPAKFASFIGGPFHAEIRRLPHGAKAGDRKD